MPYVNVRVAGTLTREQKQQLVAEITDSLKRIAGKPESATYVVIDEVPRGNWAKSGELLE